VNAYELGLKSKWHNDTVLTNIDVFRSDYKDLQATATIFDAQLNGYFSEVKNIASSVAQGIEFEGQWAASRNLRLGANVTYLDSYYVRYPGATPTLLGQYCGGLSPAAYQATPQCAGFPNTGSQDLSGRPTDYAPKWSGVLDVAYSFALARDYRVTGELTPYFTSSYFLGGASASTDDPLGMQHGYVRLDARLALESPDGHWIVDLIGKNLTGRIIITANETASEVQTREEFRNIAVQFRYRFSPPD